MGQEFDWQCGATADASTNITTGIYAYNNAVVFTQRYPNGAKGTNVLAQNCTGSSEGSEGCTSEPFGRFPAIAADATDTLLPNMTFFTVSGNMNEYREQGVGMQIPFGQDQPNTGRYMPNGAMAAGPFLMFEEDAAAAENHVGSADRKTAGGSDDGGGSGSKTPGLHVVFSPMNNFMTFTESLLPYGSPLPGSPNRKRSVPPNATQKGRLYVAGIHYEVESVPANFNHSTLLWFGAAGEGPTETVLGWGNAMQQIHAQTGTVGKAPVLKDDPTTTQLGAWTDAGTVYYRPPADQDMQATLSEWVGKLHQNGVPVTYLQLDDWFYPTGDGGIRCIQNFTTATQGSKTPFHSGYFPSDLGTLQKNVSLPLHLYHACFDGDNVYKDTFDFDVIPTATKQDHGQKHFAQVAANQSYAFYTMLWQTAKRETNGRFVGSEVDHQVDTIHYMNKHRTLAGYAEQYYLGMSQAAVEAGISLQFCMSLPRHILTTLMLDGVTHARASYDNHGSVMMNISPLFASSLFFQAVGLRPSKDNAQTVLQPDGHPDPELEILVAVLTTGPVGLGDGMALGTDAAKAKASCTSNGTLLQPTRPLSGIDAMFSRHWNPKRAQVPPSGFVMQTHTIIPAPAASGPATSQAPSTHLVLAIGTNETYTMPESQLFPAASAASYYVRVRSGGSSSNNGKQPPPSSTSCTAGSDAVKTGCVAVWTPSAGGLALQTGPGAPNGRTFPWSMWTVYPKGAAESAANSGGGGGGSSKWVVLGELDKFVHLSARRFTKLVPSADGATMSVCMAGAPNEAVDVTAISPAGLVAVFPAVLSAEGSACITVG